MSSRRARREGDPGAAARTTAMQAVVTVSWRCPQASTRLTAQRCHQGPDLSMGHYDALSPLLHQGASGSIAGVFACRFSRARDTEPAYGLMVEPIAPELWAAVAMPTAAGTGESTFSALWSAVAAAPPPRTPRPPRRVCWEALGASSLWASSAPGDAGEPSSPAKGALPSDQDAFALTAERLCRASGGGSSSSGASCNDSSGRSAPAPHSGAGTAAAAAAAKAAARLEAELAAARDDFDRQLRALQHFPESCGASTSFTVDFGDLTLAEFDLPLGGSMQKLDGFIDRDDKMNELDLWTPRITCVDAVPATPRHVGGERERRPLVRVASPDMRARPKTAPCNAWARSASCFAGCSDAAAGGMDVLSQLPAEGSLTDLAQKTGPRRPATAGANAQLGSAENVLGPLRLSGRQSRPTDPLPPRRHREMPKAPLLECWAEPTDARLALERNRPLSRSGSLSSLPDVLVSSRSQTFHASAHGALDRLGTASSARSSKLGANRAVASAGTLLDESHTPLPWSTNRGGPPFCGRLRPSAVVCGASATRRLDDAAAAEWRPAAPAALGMPMSLGGGGKGVAAGSKDGLYLLRQKGSFSLRSCPAL
eukprot:TRINITY_DN4121_c0_g5_i1.p1 TRINITY_DN4121_c0_g5~~TRINITY_DN4121_c0_g5_i1.p1  ORF type:complete len:597 (+),score=75.80 TRINITY_DN4121_c0_g5_i1:612-2402(+)